MRLPQRLLKNSVRNFTHLGAGDDYDYGITTGIEWEL
jgi:hypothetical protein